MEINSIINEIKALDAYVNAMRKLEDREPKRQDLDNLLYHGFLIGYILVIQRLLL